MSESKQKIKQSLNELIEKMDLFIENVELSEVKMHQKHGASFFD